MTSNPSKFVSFAPYTPPPDDPILQSSSKSRAWLQNPSGSIPSYQEGGVPSFGSSIYNERNFAPESEASNQWETRYGMRVDILAASSYLLGPISALVVLIIETHNDFVRFHAYQSALLTSPLIFLRMLLAIVQLPHWVQTLTTLLIILLQIFIALRVYHDISFHGLSRYTLPVVGRIADRWLAEE